MGAFALDLAWLKWTFHNLVPIKAYLAQAHPNVDSQSALYSKLTLTRAAKCFNANSKMGRKGTDFVSVSQAQQR